MTSTTPFEFRDTYSKELVEEFYGHILDSLVFGDYGATSWLARFPGNDYLIASIQGRVFRGLGNADLAAKWEELAQQLGSRLLPLSRRARIQGNSAYAANRMSLALHYYEVAIMSDPCDMRPFLNKSAIMLRTADPDAHFYALLALKMGLVFGAPQRLIDKARARVKAGLQQSGAVMGRANSRLLSVDFRLQWSPPAPDDTAIETESEQLVREIELCLGFLIFGISEEWYSEAAEHFSAAISLAPAEPGAYMERAVCRLRLADYAAGLADADMAIDLMGATTFDPLQWPRAFWLKGLCQIGLDNWREALRAFEEAKRLDPFNAKLANSCRELMVLRSMQMSTDEWFARIVQEAKVDLRK